MNLLSRLIFGLVDFSARGGLAETPDSSTRLTARQSARRRGIRGETYAYWYLRRNGYVLIARNYTASGFHGEIDLIGYDGPVLAFVEVKTRTGDDSVRGRPEEAVTPEKRRRLVRMARQFLAERRIPEAACRFDVLAIENHSGRPPAVRLHKGAFSAEG
jgi:putative endonuclease